MRFQEVRRLPVGADAPGGDIFEVQLTNYSQSVLSDHKIQILHAMQVYADAPGQEEMAEGIDQQHQHQVHHDVYHES